MPSALTLVEVPSSLPPSCPCPASLNLTSTPPIPPPSFPPALPPSLPPSLPLSLGGGYSTAPTPFVFDLWGFQKEQLGGSKTVRGREGGKEGGKEGRQGWWLVGWMFLSSPFYTHSSILPPSLPPSLRRMAPWRQECVSATTRPTLYTLICTPT